MLLHPLLLFFGTSSFGSRWVQIPHNFSLKGVHLRSLGPLEGPWWCPRSGRGRTDPAAPGAWRTTQGGSESGGRLSAALFRRRHRAELLESPGMHGHWVKKNGDS